MVPTLRETIVLGIGKVAFRVFHKTGFGIPRAIAFVLAAIFAPFMASTARAECGDYVQIPSNTPVKSEISAYRLLASPSVALLGERPVSSEHRGPCHGPNCSRKPERAPLPPVVSNLTSGKLSASISSSQEIAEIGDQPYAVCDSFLRPVGHPFRCERPPRY